LAEKRDLAVVVRIVVDRNRQLVHGELVDMNGTSRGRFADWDTLIRLIRVWLDHLDHEAQPAGEAT
jgi:hypothetical protein